MKTAIIAIILAFTITHVGAQSMTCSPSGPNMVCAPTAPPSSAGLGSALVVIGVLWLVISYLKSNENSEENQK